MRMSLLTPAILAVSLFQPNSGFQRIVGGIERERGIAVIATRDGGYLAVGSVRKSETDEDIYLVRTDRAGQLLWSRTIGGEAQDNGWAVHELEDGLLVGGFTRSFGAGGLDFYLVKTDPAGQMEWSRTYGGAGDDLAWDLAVLEDGFLLAGQTTSEGNGEEDCLLVRIDPDGVQLWSRAFGGEKGDRCFSVEAVDGGGFLLAGQTFSSGAGDRDAYLVRTDESGVVLWERTYGGAESDVAHSVARTPDGGFLITGYTTSLAADQDDPFLIKIDSLGAEQWTRVLPLAGSNHTLNGAAAGDGGFCLAGFTEMEDRRAALLVKTDAAGRLEWQREFLSTTEGESLAYGVAATADGGCVATGHTTLESAGDLDLLLLKVGASHP